jgi:hypothetical protein
MKLNILNKLGFLVFCCTALSAQADTTGVYALQDEGKKDAGTMTIQWRDAQHIRYDMQGKKADESGSLLLLGEKFYVLTPQGEVMDMDMLGGLVGALGAATKPKVAPSMPDFKATGRSETVAGLNGEIYQWNDGKHRGETVLSTDPRAQRLSMAMERMGDHMEKSFADTQASKSYRQMRNSPELRDKGILRAQEAQGGEMRLVRVDEKPIADAQFTLPKKAGAKAMPGLPNGIPNMNDPQIQMLMKEIMKSQGH